MSELSGLARYRAKYGQLCEVFITDINTQALEAAKKQIPGVLTKVCDNSKRAEIEAMISILDGKKGEVMPKVMRTIVKYGEVFRATRLLPLDGPIHIVTSMGMAGLDAVFDFDNSALWAGYKL